MPASKKRSHTKTDTLKETGTLNTDPQSVRDPKFQQGEFFDPLDLVQVKYEMLRRVSMDNASITDATGEYGFCRPTYYQARSNFEEGGLAGLLPKKRGPQGPHKLQHEVLAFLERQTSPGEPIQARKLAVMVKQKFNVDVHPRTIERALGGKKTRQ